MKRTMRKISPNGDDKMHEYEQGVTSPEKLAAIEAEFNTMVGKGWIAADITDKKDTIIRKFDPNADILMIPQMRGGSWG